MASDVTEFQHALRENTRLMHAYQLLRRASEVIRSAESRDAMLRGVCERAVADGTFPMAWVGLVEPASLAVTVAASAGAGVQFLEGMTLSAADIPAGQGPTGRAIREQRPVICRDFETDELFLPWRERALAFGLRSAGAFPLRVDGQVVGALMVYAGERNAFGDDEIALLSDVAADLSAGLEAVERRELQARSEQTVRQLQTQQQRAQRLESIGTLAGGIAHDLNNTLAPIVMSVGLLKRQRLDEGTMRHVRTIEASAGRAAALVKQVLSFARGMEGEKVVLAVRHVMRDVARMLDHTLLKEVRVDVSAPRDLPCVLADPTQLHQVLLNLCVNAAQAMHGRGSLRIAGKAVTLDDAAAAAIPDGRAGEFLCLSVTDSGDGMSHAILDRIFEPFFTTKPAGEGTGLGLSTTLGIVRSHDGFIGVESAVGEGSVFRVYLPVTTEDGSGPAALEERGTAPRGHGELILVVDDELTVLELTREALEQAGFRVVSAHDGAEGVGLFAQHAAEVALVLADMKMPIMDGIAMLHAIRRLRRDVRAVAMSGVESLTADAESFDGSGEAHTLTKPFAIDALLRTVREALDAPARTT